MDNINVCLIAGLFLIIIFGAGVECEECLPNSECMNQGGQCTTSSGKSGTCYMSTWFVCGCFESPPTTCTDDSGCGVGKCCQGTCYPADTTCCGTGSDAGVCLGGTQCCLNNGMVVGCYDPSYQKCCSDISFGKICSASDHCCGPLCCPNECCIYQPEGQARRYECIDHSEEQCCLERICPAGDECCGEECCAAGSARPYCIHNFNSDINEMCVECKNNEHCDDGDPCTEDTCVGAIANYACVHNGCSTLDVKLKCIINDLGQKVCAMCETFDTVQCDITDNLLDRVQQYYDEAQKRCRKEMTELNLHCGTDPCDESEAGQTKNQCTEGKLLCKREVCQMQSDGSYKWVTYNSQYCQGGTCQDNVPAGDCSCIG